MNQRSTKKSPQRLATFGIALLLAAACGGRAVTIEDSGSAGDGAAATSAAGMTSSHGGTSSTYGGASSTRGGSTSFSGSASTIGGAIGYAGTSSFGGCGPTTCPFVPACDGPNEMLVTPPGECCAVCESTCAQQVCVSGCPSGYTLQMVAGQCCPTCVLSDCNVGRNNYESQKAALSEKYAFGCKTDADCVATAVSNACEESACPAYSSILDALNADWQTNLNSAAVMDCSSCPQTPPGPPPPCLPPFIPKCAQGACTFAN